MCSKGNTTLLLAAQPVTLLSPQNQLKSNKQQQIQLKLSCSLSRHIIDAVFTTSYVVAHYGRPVTSGHFLFFFRVSIHANNTRPWRLRSRRDSACTHYVKC